jgi:hypothetical protein
MAMVYRIFVEKKNELAHEAAGLYSELKNLLGIKNLESVRVLNRYDADDIDAKFSEDALEFPEAARERQTFRDIENQALVNERGRAALHLIVQHMQTFHDRHAGS